VFSSYAEAMRSCQGLGYEEERLIEVVFRKTVAHRDHLQNAAPVFDLSSNLMLFALGLAFHSSGPIRVLDFGGACGLHYFKMRHLFPNGRVAFQWHVVETPSMVRRAVELENTELKFYDSLSQAAADLGPIDVLLASGVLQCVADPYQCLAELLACGGRYLVLARLGCTRKSEPLITVHETRLSDNGSGPMPIGLAEGTCLFPYTFPAHSVVQPLITSRYKVLLQTQDNTGWFEVQDEPIMGVAYVAERRSEAE
jgi:putative methyltransferase (TIGR04325 family)